MRVALAGNAFGDTPLEQVAQLMKTVGIRHLELGFGTNIKEKDEWSEAQALLHRFGIEIAGLSVSARFEPGGYATAQREIIQAVEIAALCGAKWVNTYAAQTHCTRGEDAVREHAARLLPCVEAAADRGIVLLMESELSLSEGNPSRLPETAVAVVEQVDSPYFKLTYEPVNLFLSSGVAWSQAYETLRNHIAHVHLKDVAKCTPALRAQYPRHRVWKGWDGEYICMPLGAGELPLDRILDRLKTDDYDGLLTLEPFTWPEPYRQGIAYLRKQGVIS